MVVKITQVEEQESTQEWQMSPLSENVAAICERAIALARTKLPVWQQEADLAELLQRRAYLGYLKQAVAHDMAALIADHDPRVRALYVFEESANPDSETEDFLTQKDLTIHLLALVEAPSAALDAFVASADRALSDTLRGLPAPAFAGHTSFLDVIPVTNKDVEAGRGHAVLLNSVYAPPIKLWERA